MAAAASMLYRTFMYGSPISFLLLTYHLLFYEQKEAEHYGSLTNFECSLNFVPAKNNSCIPCPSGHFSLRGWIACLPYLNCVDIAHDVRTRRRLGSPGHLNAVKEVFLADWFGYDVVYSKCASVLFSEDCLHGMEMVSGLQGSQFVVQLIGICYESLELVTGYHKHGSADNLESLLLKPEMSEYRTVKHRFQLCIEYVKILDFLHNSPIGTRVMCDSNDIHKTLSQYLITDDFHLVVNDLDALPLVNQLENKLIKCGHRQLFGDFVAPEQLWPYEGAFFDDQFMPPYDEKIDIWRIPNVVDKILGRVKGGNRIRRLLLRVHDQCKLTNPRGRPTAAEVLVEFLKVDQLTDDGLQDEI